MSSNKAAASRPEQYIFFIKEIHNPFSPCLVYLADMDARPLQVLSLPATVVPILLIQCLAWGREHPFLLFHAEDLPAMRQKVKTLEWSGKAFKDLQKRVDRAGQPELPPVNAKIRSEWSRTINRHGRTAQEAAFLYRMTGDSTYFHRAREVLLLFARNFDRLSEAFVLKGDKQMVVEVNGTPAKAKFKKGMLHYRR